MSVDVYGQNGGEIFFSNAGWAFMLNFAMAYGWKPTGTLAPADRVDWDGNYSAPESQTISTLDAGALARAISAGLAAPDRFERSREIATRLTDEVGAPVEPFNFAPQAVNHWEDFIRIAIMGPFVIS